MHHHLSLRSKVIILVSVLASMFLVALDQTIIATALGKIVEEFNAFESLSWIVTAYLLTTTVTVPIAGKLSDLFGRRTLLLIGVGIFALGSLLSGLAGNVNELIYARAFQGIGGGIITANAFTIIGDLFAARERGKWQGMFGAVFGLSSIIGPLLGGWLTDGQAIFGLTTDWRWTFFINVPIAIVAFILIAIYCPSLRRDKRPVIDYAGATILTIGLATLVLAVDNTEQIFKGFLDATGWSLLGLRVVMYSIVALCIATFIMIERRAKDPTLPLRFFENRNFVRIMGIATLFGGAFMGSILYLTQFNQQVFGATPTESGLMLLPMIGGLMTTSIISGRMISKTGRYKIFMQVGIVVATVMIVLLSLLTPESSYAYEAIIMVFLGAGLGVVMPVMNLAVQNEFQQRDIGVATSSSQLFRSLGSTVGVAVFGAMLTAGLASGLGSNLVQTDAYIQSLASSPAASKLGDLTDSNTLLNINMPETKQAITSAFEESIASLPADAKANARATFLENQSTYASKVTHSFASSLHTIFLVSSILMAIAAVLVFSIKEKPLHKASEKEAPGIA
ncbi:MAG: MDR family MFS transporter [Candidatus Saccharimonas sp.]